MIIKQSKLKNIVPCAHTVHPSLLSVPLPLFLFFFFIQAFKLKVKHYGGNRGLFPVCSSVSKGALCRVSVTSQTSSTGLPHVETLTSPPRTKKLGRDRWEEGVRVREIENKVCVWVRGRERNPFLLVSPYFSQNKSTIRAKDAPQKPLSCFPLLSCQHDSFLSAPPLPLFSFSLTLCHTLCLIWLPIQESFGSILLFKMHCFHCVCVSFIRAPICFAFSSFYTVYLNSFHSLRC